MLRSGRGDEDMENRSHSHMYNSRNIMVSILFQGRIPTPTYERFISHE